MTMSLEPMMAANAAVFAIKNATTEGKITVIVLLLLSLFSWTIILSKFRQLLIARAATKKFFEAYSSTRDPLDIQRKNEEFDGAPAYQLYIRGADELAYQLKNNPVSVVGRPRPVVELPPGAANEHTDILARDRVTKISMASFDAVRVTLEEAAGAEAMSLEKGMIVLSTAVAGGPFIGLLGTVWGVMSTFASIAENNSASLTTMAPGVAAALVATVTGLLVAIPAMFAYNFMVTTVRAITQELDGFATRYATQIEHVYVDNRPLAEEIKSANEALAGRIVEGLKADESRFQNTPAI
jgi:biopolymer transport protein ExbB/TolQ